MLLIKDPGLQSTLQGAPRLGWRHFGIPYAGAADPLSMALANHLVGNTLDATALEITFGGLSAQVEEDCTVAVTGAGDSIEISGRAAPLHETLALKAGDALTVPPIRKGARAYLAIASGFQAQSQFGSTSTYLPGQFGGCEGRALIARDRLVPNQSTTERFNRVTPLAFRPHIGDSYALRATVSAETDLLSNVAVKRLFGGAFQIGRQATRMGLSLIGQDITPRSDGMMESAPVFPGTIQAPPSGEPFVLLCDAQTTGGYPRIASIARCDQHLLGQLRPGNQVQLLHRDFDQALSDDRAKHALFADWLTA